MKASQLAALTQTHKTVIANQLLRGVVSRPINNFVRVMGSQWAAKPLSYGDGPSRFSPVQTPGQKPPFGLIYATIDLATAVYESVIRDGLDLATNRAIYNPDYAQKSAVNVSSIQGSPLNLLDMTSGNAVRVGVPTDVIRYSDHQEGQFFSEFVYSELPSVDGFLYTSRFTEQLCVAVFDRALSTLTGTVPRQLDQALLQPVLSAWIIQVR